LSAAEFQSDRKMPADKLALLHLFFTEPSKIQ